MTRIQMFVRACALSGIAAHRNPKYVIGCDIKAFKLARPADGVARRSCPTLSAWILSFS